MTSKKNLTTLQNDSVLQRNSCSLTIRNINYLSFWKETVVISVIAVYKRLKRENNVEKSTA